jgi:hypothetical protein
LDIYRQHPRSNTAVAEASGQSRLSRLKFLHWLSTYLARHHIEDPLLHLTLRQELWLNRQPIHLPLIGGTYPMIRWIKKWILRLSKCLLPVSFRGWIWSRDSHR